jgi:hypothetical protein
LSRIGPGYEVRGNPSFKRDRMLISPPLKGAERKKIARWAILAKEPDCRGDLWWGQGDVIIESIN